MKPGEILFAEGAITLHAGRPTAEVTVTNASDHTIFISSHFPFFEVNRRLVFDRASRLGHAPRRPRGRFVRWRPGETRPCGSWRTGGDRAVRGFNRLTDGPPRRSGWPRASRVRVAGYGHRDGSAGRSPWPVS